MASLSTPPATQETCTLFDLSRQTVSEFLEGLPDARFMSPSTLPVFHPDLSTPQVGEPGRRQHIVRSRVTKSLPGLGMGRGRWIEGCSEAFQDGWAMRIKGKERLENTPSSWAWQSAGGESWRNREQGQVCFTHVCG